MDILTGICLPIGLGLVMLAMGLSLSTADFARVIREPRPILAGLASLLIAVPLVGLALARAASVAAPLAFGLFMIATCPSGTFSNLLTSYGKGDLALSITMTACGCLVYVFTAPLWVDLGLWAFRQPGHAIHLERWRAVIDLGRIILLPTGIGMALRPRLTERQRDIAEKVIKNAAAGVVVSIFLALLWRMRHELDPRVLPWVVALNAITVLLGWSASRAVGLGQRQTLSVVCEHAVRQEGTAIFLVTTLLMNPTAAIPLTVNSFVGFLMGSAFILLQRFRGLRTCPQ